MITLDEQEFVTSLLVSGKVESLSQGAHILNGILEMAATRTVQQLSNFSSSSKPTARPSIDPQKLQKIRKKYPLPTHMPRCVRLPVYDPSTENVLKFDKKQTDNLTLTAVRGTAGRLGLRKGDVLTHFNGESVTTTSMLNMHLERCSGEETVWLIVNANEETAAHLKKRAETMQRDNVRFW